VPYDPTIYRGAARHYCRGRPAYSAELVPTLTREVGLDGRGRLLDVGCGPGVLTVPLAPLFEETIGLDPDADMLAECERRADEQGVRSICWVRAVAEDIRGLGLGLGTFRLVTFGESFHWTDREQVAEVIYDLLEPGGSLVLVVNTVAGRPAPVNPGYPVIPHEAIGELVDRYLGPRRRSGPGFHPDRFEDALARTRFGLPRVIFAPGRPDIVRDTDSVVAGYFSLSWATSHRFGERRREYEAELRALLHQHSPTGLFWDWPGDTEILIAQKAA
jgi:SAM-dependent methyltransferase